MPDQGAITFEIAHPTVPPTLHVESYEELDDKRHPLGAGRRIDCTIDSEECQFVRGEDGLRVIVTLAPADQRLVVLQAAYTTWPDARERVPDAPGLMTASWAVAITR